MMCFLWGTTEFIDIEMSLQLVAVLPSKEATRRKSAVDLPPSFPAPFPYVRRTSIFSPSLTCLRRRRFYGGSVHGRQTLKADIFYGDWRLPWILVLHKLSPPEFISPPYSNELMVATDLNGFVSDVERRLCVTRLSSGNSRTLPVELS
jgi:hypothetical protein